MSFSRLLVVLAGSLVVGGIASAQGRTYQFFIRVTDAKGVPVAELRPEDVAMEESGVRQPIVRVERQPVPIKVTIAVDNSSDSADALAHYRAGLTGLVEGLPPGVEVTLMTTAPQPRMVLKPTADRAQMQRAITGFAPEPGRPRFTDTLVEFSRRLQSEARDRRMVPYRPVLIMISTAAIEQSSYEAPEITQAVESLVARRAQVHVVMLSTQTGRAATPEAIDASLQTMIAMPVVKATGGRYVPLAVSSRLPATLEEWGRDLSALHARQIEQFRVTVERAKDGPLVNPRAGLARLDLIGTVTLDGYLP